MNKNPVNGINKDLTDPVQEEAGDFVSSTSQPIHSMDRPVSSKTEEKLGDARESSKAPAFWRVMP